MKKLFLLCAGIVFLMAQVLGQNTGTIKGKLFDNDSKQTLPGANVVVMGGNTAIGCQTGLDGDYVLKPLAAGTYSIKISYMGYKTVTVDNIQVNPGKISFVDDLFISMEGITIGGKIAEKIEYRDPLIRPDPITILRPSEYKEIAGKRDLSGIISKLNSDVYMDEQGELYFRGARSDNFVYIVDGVKSMDGKAHIPSGAIGSIAIYTGGVPALYGDFTGGCVVIESKSFFDK
ncbi:MAG TPA: TonB-dependent receptor [Bacteroidales bacterium]|nr:TonB-dependent receptor [Bacteroidales bacterium]